MKNKAIDEPKEPARNLAREETLSAALKLRTHAPRKLKPVGTGAYLDIEQYAYDKGWKEGQAALRKAIREKIQLWEI